MERRMTRDLDRYITGNYGEKQMELPAQTEDLKMSQVTKFDKALAGSMRRIRDAQTPAHTCVDRPHLPCDACGSETVRDAKTVMLEALEEIASQLNGVEGPTYRWIRTRCLEAIQAARGRR